jgi:hypothetical protein
MSALGHQFRVAGKRLRAALFMRNRRLRVGTHWAWYWRWLFNLGLMIAAALLVWWLLSNQHKVTGFNPTQLREQVEQLTTENKRLSGELQASSRQTKDAEQQTAVEKATLTELSKTVAQLQEENATLKEDLGFLRKMMAAGSVAESVTLSQVQVEKVEKTEIPNQYRYRMVVTQGGDRKSDFKGKVQFVARVQRNGTFTNIVLPEEASMRTELDFKFFQRLEGRFSIPDGAPLKSVEIKVLANPGGQLKASKSVSLG